MLIGVGLGPGSSDLLTLAAVKALKSSMKVYVPGKLAADLVSPYAKPEILEFPMIQDKEKLSRIWENNAKIVADEARKGTVSFAVLGDPNVFSTFSHLGRTIREKYPDIEISTIPGVSAITAQASKTDTMLDTSFVVSDGSPVGTQIVIKAKHPASIEKMLRSDGFEDFIFAERLFMENENITEEIPETGDYFSILVASKRNSKNNGIVYFVGAGPGNPKYITVKGRELLDSADLVMYTGSLVNPELLDHVRAEKMDSHGMKLETMIEVMANTVRAGKTVVRLHSGDPSLYGAIIEQIDGLEKQGIGIKIIPGVTSLFASAASLQTQLTLNGITETLIITRPAGATLEKDSIKELSRHNATLAIYLGTHKLREIMDVVEYPKETPAAVVFHASWDDEKIIRGTVGDIADKVEAIGIERSAMIIIGNVLAPGNFKRSHLYG
jgi:precorrin-4/cobalt-precorrin-4 C11-methyltransferase